MLKKINNLILKAEMAMGRTKVLSLPKYAQIEPTNRCNQRCIFCPRNENDYNVPLGDLSLKNFKKILKEIPTLTDIQLNGLGESLLNKELFEMIKLAKIKKIKISMNTNAVLIDSEKAIKIVKSGLDVIKISMDSTKPEVYKSLRAGDLNEVIEGIKRLVAAKKSVDSGRPRIWFNTIIMNQNLDELLSILELASDLGINQVRFKPIDTFGIYNEKDLVVENKKLLARLDEALEKSKDLTMANNLKEVIQKFSDYYRPQKPLPCFSPWYEVYIQYYGGIRLCCEFYDKKYDVGNMFEEKFRKIWNNEKMRNIRQEFYKGNTFFPVCQTCNRFQRNIQIYNKLKKLKIK